MSLAELEDKAGADASHLLDLIEQGQRSNLSVWMSGRSRTELAWMALALGAAYMQARREVDALTVSNAVLQRENETLDVANAALFREKGELFRKVQESRDIRDDQASRIGVLRKRLEAHGERVH